MSDYPYRNVAPFLDRPQNAEFSFHDFVARRLTANLTQWLQVAPDANPSMLQIFRDRDRTPYRDLVPWAGEFAGKYLISATQALRLTQSQSLRDYLAHFVAELIQTQHPSGYLGCFPTAEEMIGKDRWDLWGQYHVMLGLWEWHRETGDAEALACCRRCADHFCDQFLSGSKRVYDAGWQEMNESCAHIFALLYAAFGEERYLRLLKEIEKDWEEPPSGDYVRTALEGTPFYATPKPRWESLHAVQAIAELYWITGEERYRQAFLQIWRTIQEGDRHNTGGFSSGEQATGNPYDPGAIETCCTIAWMALTQDYLRLTGDARAADELELSFYNAALGAQNPSGRWWTYNTPMDGERKASAHEIVFQARAGSPELNCCSVNAPRGIGILAEWALMTQPDGLTLNYYGPSVLTAQTPCGVRVQLTLETLYPLENRILIKVRPEKPVACAISLRLPGWSQKTEVCINDGEAQTGEAGTYLRLEREWGLRDNIAITLDMSVWAWAGEREQAGRVSLYRGPLLLAYDPRFGSFAPDELPEIDLSQPLVRLSSAQPTPEPQPILRVSAKTRAGDLVTLCDFATAGMAGNLYRSWLPASGIAPVPFTPQNPLRLTRIMP